MQAHLMNKIKSKNSNDRSFCPTLACLKSKSKSAGRSFQATQAHSENRSENKNNNDKGSYPIWKHSKNKSKNKSDEGKSLSPTQAR